jgi:hypothetical protein
MGAILLHITGIYNLSDKAGADFSSSTNRFTHSMPCPCRAAKDLECLSHLIYTARPCLIHTCHAASMPFFSRPRHSMAVERRPEGYLPPFGLFRLPCGVPRRLLSEACQSSSQRSIPTTVKSGSSILQQRRSVKLLDKQFGYFRLPRGLSRRTRHCRSMAGARHGMCESAFRVMCAVDVASRPGALKYVGSS